MKKQSKLPSDFIMNAPWKSNDTPIWPASTFILHRNLKDKLFPDKLEDGDLTSVKNQIKAVLLKSKVLKNPTFFDADELSKRDREFLYEQFLTMLELKNPRKGQGFCIDETHNIIISINFIDHICVHFVDSDSKWEESYQKVMELDKELASLLDFAYSEQFGFLTADPCYCGTGLVIESFLHLPLLLSSKKPIEIMNHVDNGIMFSSMTRNLEFTGDIGIIQNNFTLGISEDQIMHLLHTNALKLMNLEKELQKKALEKPTPQVKDLVSRSIGMLTNSFQMDAKEALTSLSMLKLGIHLGWVQGVNLKKIHRLFFDVQRAHLQLSMGKETPSKELSEERARYLKDILKEVAVSID